MYFFKTQTHQTEDEMHKSILFSENRVSRSPIILIRLRSRSPIGILGLRLRLRPNDRTPRTPTSTPKPCFKRSLYKR